MQNFFSLSPESKQILDSVSSILKKTFPIPERFRNALPSNIAELSRLLTNKRADRSLSYLGRPNFLSAYMHYYFPWNLYRLCILLPSLQLNLKAGSIITDLGCGPLTFVSALWIVRPDLRSVPLEFNCIDRAGPALEAGKNFFTALCASNEQTEIPSLNWKINIIKKDININKTEKRKNKASLVCAVNLFNEIYENISHNDTESLHNIAEKAANFMHNEAEKDAVILTVEPGVPQSGKFISLLRDTFMELERMPLAPCTHAQTCPFRQKRKEKQRWCHFAFEALDAPKDLVRLSKAAKLPKERLVLSFLQTGAVTINVKIKQNNQNIQTRVISDAFPLPGNKFGRYGCSSQGLILLTSNKEQIEKIGSLSLVETFLNGQRDEKSGALIAEVI